MAEPVSPLGLIAGTQVEVVGIDEKADDGFRVYLGHRMNGIYVLIDDAEKQDELRRMWANTALRIVVNTPPSDALHREDDQASAKETTLAPDRCGLCGGPTKDGLPHVDCLDDIDTGMVDVIGDLRRERDRYWQALTDIVGLENWQTEPVGEVDLVIDGKAQKGVYVTRKETQLAMRDIARAALTPDESERPDG